MKLYAGLDPYYNTAWAHFVLWKGTFIGFEDSSRCTVSGLPRKGVRLVSLFVFGFSPGNFINNFFVDFRRWKRSRREIWWRRQYKYFWFKR